MYESIGVFLFLTYFTLRDTLLGPSRSLQMTQYRSFLWVSNIPLCVYTHRHIYIYTHTQQTDRQTDRQTHTHTQHPLYPFVC